MPFTSTKRQCARRCYQHRCPRCPGQEFPHSAALIRHLKKSYTHRFQENSTFECATCNDEFGTKTGFIQHLRQKRIHKYDLHQAACCGRFQDVGKLIYSENADVTGASHLVKPDLLLNYQLGTTPMHCAAFKGYSKCLRIMLSWPDGNPNVPDKHDGQTPVHIAARCGRASSLKLLLNKGGSLDIKDKNGVTPIDLANRYCMDVIIEHHIGRVIWKYCKHEITVRRSLSFKEIDECETRKNNSEYELAIPTEEIGSASTPSCSRNLPQQTNGNLQQIVRHSDSLSKDRCASDETCEVPSELLPYEVIARGEQAVEIFKKAICAGTAPASRLKLIVVGEIGAGKTSLTRSLSQQPFLETREKTRGIQTSTVSETMVENTELNVSWKLADPEDSHVDELVARIVSESLGNVPEGKPSVAALSVSPEGSNANQVAELSSINECPGLSTPPKDPVAPKSQSRVLITQPCISVEGTPRKLPATRIAKKLLQKKSEPSSVKVNIWDFAGHQLYETMHHVFMNSRSLYLVVFSLLKMAKSQNKSLTRIHYWLNSIASHTSCSTPIILVGTHQGMVDFDFVGKTNQLLEKHFGVAFGPRLVRNDQDEILFAVENSRGQEDPGISSLIKVIKSEASCSLPFVVEELPLKWLHCEEEIITYQQLPNTKKCLTIDEVQTLLEDKCNVTFTEEEFRSMLAFFQDSGLILLPNSMNDDDTKPCLKDLVVLSPQYLVDVMTRIHDVPQDRTLKRQFSDEFKKLKEEGRADCRLLDHVWKGLEKTEVLVELLSRFNLLHPLLNEIDDESTEVSTICGGSFSSSVVASATTEFMIPCMLKEKSEKSVEMRWNKICEQWKATSNEHVLVFDFGRFLPPALFDYLLVHIYRHSQKTKAMRPILKRRTGIFSFSNKFVFRIELVLEYSQIWVYARTKKGETFLKLAYELKKEVSEICQQNFKFLKFICGPPCPRKDCPGASFDAEVIQRPCESSSSGSSDSSEDDVESKDMEEKASKAQSHNNENETRRRRHIIPIIPNSFDPPYWCQEVELENDDLMHWNPADAQFEDLCQSFEEAEITDGFQEKIMAECCLSIVAGCLGDSWKEIGRKLDVAEAEIENIRADHHGQKEQGLQMLLTWKKRLGSGARGGVLMKTLVKADRKDIAERLEEHYHNLSEHVVF